MWTFAEIVECIVEIIIFLQSVASRSVNEIFNSTMENRSPLTFSLHHIGKSHFTKNRFLGQRMNSMAGWTIISFLFSIRGLFRFVEPFQRILSDQIFTFFFSTGAVSHFIYFNTEPKLNDPNDWCVESVFVSLFFDWSLPGISKIIRILHICRLIHKSILFTRRLRQSPLTNHW